MYEEVAIAFNRRFGSLCKKLEEGLISRVGACWLQGKIIKLLPFSPVISKKMIMHKSHEGEYVTQRCYSRSSIVIKL